MAEIINIKNEAGEVQYPVTKPECVIDENGKSVLTLIQENGTELRQEIYELSTDVSNLSDEVESNGQLIEDLQNMKIDRENDDYYPKMAVGLADNLAGVDVVDSEINFRRSGGGAISDGVARIEAIKGNSVVWNQRFNKGVNTNGEVWVNNLITINVNNTSKYQKFDNNADAKRGIITHKYLQRVTKVSGAVLQGSLKWYSYAFARATTIDNNTPNGVILEYIGSIAIDNAYWSYRDYSEGTTAEELVIRQVIYDLTKMFGAGNEPTTIEEFYARIPMGVDLNAYNEGEVIHMDVQSIESQGVNAWDGSLFDGYVNDETGAILRPNLSGYKSTGFVRVLPNTQYYIRTDSTSGRWGAWYDKDQNHISGIVGAGIHTSPSNAAYMRMTIVYNNNGNTDTVCIHISDTSINGKYFPYIKRVEDLSIIRKYFPNGMKSAGTAHDEIRYNKATQKWEYSKGKIKSLRLADLVWYYSSANGYFYSKNIDNLKSIGTNKINILCDVIVSCDWSNFVVNYGGNKATMIAPYTVVNTTNSRVNILNAAYTDVSAFVAWLEEANATLYYESNDWEWVELDAEDQFKDLDYQVWNCGTEKAIAEGKSAPLAADITYGFNAIGKIKELESLVAQLRAKVGI